MKSPERTAGTTKKPGNIPALLAFLGAFAFALHAVAQDVVAPRSQEDLVPAALQQALLAQNVVPSQAVPSYVGDTPIVESGPFTVRGHFTYRYLNGDGIPSPTGQRLTTAIHSLSPEIFVDFGTHWTFDYSPTWMLYSNSAFTDSVDESVRLTGWGTYEDWTVQTTHSYNTSSSPLVETGVQTKQTYWSNDFHGTYSINSAMALELDALHSYQAAESFTSSHEFSTTDWLHYKVVPHVDLSAGFALGYVDLNVGPDMTYITPQARVTWTVTNKIQLVVHGGEERRHFLSGGNPDLNSPVYGVSVVWQPIETTKITIGNEHQVAAAFLQSEVSRSNLWNAQVEQRLFQKFFLTLGATHDKADYLPLVGSLEPPRTDNAYSFNARLSTTVLRRCSVALIYQDSHNSSTLPGFGLSSSQYGFEIGYRY